MITGGFSSFQGIEGFDNLLADGVNETLYFGLFRLAYSSINGIPVLLINGKNGSGSEESVYLHINTQVYDMLTRCYKDMMLYEVSDVINDKSINVASTKDILGVSCLVSVKVSLNVGVLGLEASFALGCRYQDGSSIFNSVSTIPKRKELISQARDLFDKLTTVNGRGCSPITAFFEAQVEMFA